MTLYVGVCVRERRRGGEKHTKAQTNALQNMGTVSLPYSHDNDVESQAKADAAASAKAQEDTKAKKEAEAKVCPLTRCFVMLWHM